MKVIFNDILEYFRLKFLCLTEISCIINADVIIFYTLYIFKKILNFNGVSKLYSWLQFYYTFLHALQEK